MSHDHLSARFLGSFAYLTVKDRLPAILTQIVDRVHRHHAHFVKTHGEEGGEAGKKVVSLLSKLRSELLTDKPLQQLEDGRSDCEIWNEYLEWQRTKLQPNEEPSWFKSPWLYVECYMYRKVQEIVGRCEPLCEFDVFADLKLKSFMDSQRAIMTLADHIGNILDNIENLKEDDLKDTFMKLLQVSLWGNKCDLSISAGLDNAQKDDPLAALWNLRSRILIDDSESVWSVLNKRKRSPESTSSFRLDIALDNAGFELFTDLVLVEFLQSANLVDQVHFHGKSIPWFISDITKEDFVKTIKTLCSTNHRWVSRLGVRWHKRVQDGLWAYHDHDFWTLPHDYADMVTRSPELYAELQCAQLILFKGDLHYRKLSGDLQWEHTTSFAEALRGFEPSSLCSLRALKADVQVGLKPGQAEQLSGTDAKWMVSGEYAVVQFHSPAH
uniref:damage-control phosphatase ARMT1 n=1 Tax=Myxine glutinosa TaxID=7769 RepID=UPI00358ED420